MKTSVKVLITAALLTLTVVNGSLALIGDTPTIRVVALVRSSASLPQFETYALIGDTPANTHQLILRSVDPRMLLAALDMNDVLRRLMEKTLAAAQAQGDGMPGVTASK